MNRRSSALQFAFSLAAILALFSTAALLAFLGSMFNSQLPGSSATPIFMLAGGMAFAALLLLPSAGYALLKLIGKIPQPRVRFSDRQRTIALVVLAFVILPLILFLGDQAVNNSALSWWLLPPLHVLAVSIPLLWFVSTAVKGLPAGSPQRLWGTFGAGLVLGPTLIMIAEIATLLFFSMALGIAMAQKPEWGKEMVELAQRLRFAPSPEAIYRILQPYLGNPLLIFSVFAFAAVIVPLIEETIKPLGVWLLAGRNLSPAEGFAAGVLSGAGYALFESLLLAASDEQWVMIVIARISTGALHIITSGLTGWGLALAWREGRYWRLGLVYALALLMHSLWNGLIVILVAASASLPQQVVPSWLTGVGVTAVAGLVGLFLISSGLIVGINRMFRRTVIPPRPSSFGSVESGTESL